MLNGILGAAFLQSAGRAGKGEKVGKIQLFTQSANPTISSITGTDIVVNSIVSGQPHTDTYASLSGDTLAISADKNTEIIITGIVTEMENVTNTDFISIKAKNTALTQLVCTDCYTLQTLDLSQNTALTQLVCGSCYILQTLDLSQNTALTQLVCSSCYTLQTLDLSNNTALTQLDCTDCQTLQTLDLSQNTALTQLDCGSCYILQTLDLSQNTALTQLDCGSSAKIETIKYPATNEDVATAIADAITDADADNGTVYTDSDAAYYSTIADAATAKGWTIEQLS